MTHRELWIIRRTAEAKLLLAWSRSLPTHGLTFETWLARR